MEDICAGKVNLKKEEEIRYCQIHLKFCEYYCETETKALCSDCVILNECPDHHVHISLTTAAQNHTDELKMLLAKCGDTMKRFHDAVEITKQVTEEMTKNSQKVRDSLVKVKKEYIDLVTNRVKQLEEEVDQIEQARGDMLDQKQAVLESIIRGCQRATGETSRILESQSAFDILTSHVQMSSQLLKLHQCQPDVVHLSSLGYVKLQATELPTLNIGKLLKKETSVAQWKLVGQFKMADFCDPYGLDVDRTDSIVICDFAKGVKIFSREGHVKNDFQFSGAVDVAVSVNQKYLIAPTTMFHVFTYDRTGKQMHTIPVHDMNRQSSKANSLAVDSSGRVIIGQATNTISIHNTDGLLIAKFATQSRPYRLAVTTDGEIIASMNKGESLQLMDYSGGNVRVIQPPEEIKIWKPGFVCCGQGEIFVCNQGSGHPAGVYRFSSRGDYLGCVTTSVGKPRGIALSNDGTELFIADKQDNCVKIFQRS